MTEQDAMPHTLKTKEAEWFTKRRKKEYCAKINNIKQTHVEIRLTKRMIILYPLSWSQRKYSYSDL